MKIKSVAAVGAMGLGMGFVGLIGGTATASAACGLPTTPPVERVSCLVNADIAAFADSANPVNQVNTFLNGTDTEVCDGMSCVLENDGLGVLDQPATFAQSLSDFAAGPVSSAG